MCFVCGERVGRILKKTDFYLPHNLNTKYWNESYFLYRKRLRHLPYASPCHSPCHSPCRAASPRSTRFHSSPAPASSYSAPRSTASHIRRRSMNLRRLLRPKPTAISTYLYERGGFETGRRSSVEVWCTILFRLEIEHV